MRNILLSSLLVLAACGAFVQFSGNEDSPIKDQPVYELIRNLGGEKVAHEIEGADSLLIAQGRAIINIGEWPSDTGSTGVVSPYFTCVSCHNTVREDPDLRNPTPESRLAYVSEVGQGFFQASTFWGIVNRESWFNDDYVKKYGDDAKKAQNSLIEAIQLCSRECSQGRELTEWEMKAVLAYFWSIQLKIGDLDLTEDQLADLQSKPKGKKGRAARIDWLKKQYMLASHAHVGEVPADKAAGYGLKGDRENGKRIYQSSCRLCHYYNVAEVTQIYEGGPIIEMMVDSIASSSTHSLYEVIRKGTHPVKNQRQYMPYYPVERMSDQQIEDLRAYFDYVIEMDE